MMAIRLNSFAKIYIDDRERESFLSGMRMETCQQMIDMLNRDVTPWVLEEGSVGASGDLVPLAMIGAVLIGLEEAKAYHGDQLYSAREALERAGLKPIELDAKEAMGLTNGATFIAAMSVFAVRDTELLLKNASISAALSLEAIRGENDAFSDIINLHRPHEGQKKIAQQMKQLLEGSLRSDQHAQTDFFVKPGKVDEVKDKALQEVKNLLDVEIPPQHREKYEKIVNEIGLNIHERIVFEANEKVEDLRDFLDEIKIKDADKIINRLQEMFGEVRVQDRYSFRAVPQVHGPVHEAIEKLKTVLEIEINSSTDNPLFYYDEKGLVRAKSGANFHGQPLAAVIDYLKITLTSLGLISDKRSFSLLDDRLSYGLPASLAYDTSKADGGLMIVQYAGAARAAECRVLSTPSSVMSLSTSASQEDFVSMGSIGVIHLWKIIHNVQVLLGIELLCALRAVQMTDDYLPEDLRSLGKGTTKAFHTLNKVLPLVKEDKYLMTDMEKTIGLVKSGKLVEVVADLLE
jgi:histidine ammonia-lyase